MESSLMKVEETKLVAGELSQRERQDLKLQAQMEVSEKMGQLGILFAMVTLDPEQQTKEDAVLDIAANMTLESAKELLSQEVEFLSTGKATLQNFQHIRPQSDLAS